MKPIIAILASLLMAQAALADELTIIDVRKNIPLSDDEPAYKDFYLAGGSVSGLKKNLVVTAVRKMTIRDSRGTQSYGEIEIPVGQLRILAVFGNVAVAREYQLLSRDENPMLEQTGLMSGDRIEIKGSFVDDKPAKKPKAVTEIEAPSALQRETASLPASAPLPTVAAAAVPAPTEAAASVPAAVSEPEIAQASPSETKPEGEANSTTAATSAE